MEDRSFVILHGAVGGAELGDLALLAGEAFDDLHALRVLAKGQNHLIAQLAIVAIRRLDDARKPDGTNP